MLFVRAGGANDHKLLHNDGRLPRTANNPLDHFEVFAATWAEHYISFDLKQTDWDKNVAANRQKGYVPDHAGTAVRGLRGDDQAFRRRPHRR
jgi:hypothetical protein